MLAALVGHSAIAETVATLNVQAEGRTLRDRLGLLRKAVPGRIAMTTSFGVEDQLITHEIAVRGLAIELVTLDTGRLFPETIETWDATEARYGVTIRAVAPDRDAVEAITARDGPMGFRRSVSARHACCDARKVAPLARALAGASAWITGLRAGQSPGRAATRFAVFDEAHGLLKVSPLFDVSREAVLAALRANDVPWNPLEERGFRSIGCQPCTRAVGPDEDERAGRWWWEQDAARECGLHVGPDGKLRRTGARPERGLAA